jgi:hypothetical protein
MSQDEFVAYLGVPDIHDGVVKRVSVSDVSVEVVIEGFSGRELVVLFDGLAEIEMDEPEGMLLYALSEMRAASPFRKFVFANNKEDDQKALIIVARVVTFSSCPTI